MPIKQLHVPKSVVAILDGNYLSIGNISECNVTRGYERGRLETRFEITGYAKEAALLKTPIERVIFNNPATIVFWKDGAKTVVKCQPGDKFDKMTGLSLAIAKYFLGNTGRYYNVLKPYIEDGK